jgi:SAM-dependent methyltransferase
MNNTSQSFYDKWHKNKTLVFDNTLNEKSEIFKWILSRNGFKSAEELRAFLKNKRHILDAGCGNGRVTALLSKYSDETAEIVGIDLVAADVAKENLSDYRNVTLRSKDLLGDLTDLGFFDFIYCQEVLHHTNDPFRAFTNLVNQLTVNGQIAIYVYKKKAPLREYSDDCIRNKIGDMEYEEAMNYCRQITELGRALHEQDVKIKIPAVELLEIPEGEYPIQRFLYHFFVKCFWNDELTFEENAVINYDWFHPQNCSRHTLEEVQSWFRENGVRIEYEHVDFYGITVRGVKN